MRKNKFKKITALLLTLILVLSSVPISVSAATVQLTGNDTDGYSVNMPVTGTDTLDLSDRSLGFTFKVYDDGGSGANYSNNCEGYLQITAPTNCLIQLSGSGNSESTTFDWLIIYDGSDNTALKLGGDQNGKYAGRPFTVSPILSSGNVITLWFRSDSSETYSGFELDVTLIDLSKYASVEYFYAGSTQRSMVSKGTEITLPEFSSMFIAPEGSTFLGWKCGETLYNENDAFTADSDVTFTAKVQEPPVVFGDDETGWYSNMPVTGTTTADLSDKDAGFELHVYDDGGADANYSSYCNGTLRIVAPERCMLRFSGSGTTENSYDYLRLYDGDTNKVLGNDKNTGSFAINSAMTSGNVLKLYFYSDSSVVKTGFDLTVTVVDTSSLISLSFDPGAGSGTMNSLSGMPGDRVVIPDCGFTLPEGYFFSHYSDGTTDYLPGAYFTFGSDNKTLTAVYVEKIAITYVSGSDTVVQYHPKGSTFALPVYDNIFNRTPYRKQFKQWRCANDGNAYAVVHQVTANEAMTFTAEFNDLPILIEDGNGGYYMIQPSFEDISLDLSNQPNGFTFKLYDSGGSGGYYTHNNDGSMTLTAPEGYVFGISGDGQTQSGNDVLSLYDSDGTTLLGGSSYSGNFTLSDLQTTSNTLKVHFTSDGTNNRSGFALNIKLFDPSMVLTISFNAGDGSGTMDSITVLSGTAVTLPDYGFTAPDSEIFSGYSDGTNTYWPGNTITLEANMTLTAQWAAATGFTYTCKEESKAVRYPLGSTVALPELTDLFTMPAGMHFVGWKEKFSGDIYQPGDTYVADAPTVFTAQLEILYYDDEDGYYALMPLWNVNDPLVLDLSDKSSGFSFTLYDEGGKNGNHTDNNDAEFVVKAPENMVVTVSGNVVLERTYDYLRFYNGPTDKSNVLGENKYFGNNVAVGPLMTDDNYLTIYFHSDYLTNNTGFELTITVTAMTSVTYEFDGETKVVAVQKDSTIQLAEFDDLFDSETKEFICWQNGEDTYDEGDEFVVTDNVTFTAVTRLMPTATFDGNGATVIGGDGETVTPGIPSPTGTTEQLPHANLIFNIPEDKFFGGWLYNGRTYAVGEEFTITENVTFTAIWRDANAWDQLGETLNAASGTDLGTITLTEDAVADIGSLPLIIPSGVTVTIDLNGHALDGTDAAVMGNGSIIFVYGAITLIDSASGATLTGGGIQVYCDATFAPSAELEACFGAKLLMTYDYDNNDTNEEFEDQLYAAIWYPTLLDAFTVVGTIPKEFKDELTLPANNRFWYNDFKVVMLSDAVIPEGEAWDVSSDDSICLDLNGHTIDIQGTLTGGIQGWQYQGGEYIPTFYPTNIQIVSTTPGVFRSSGNIGVSIAPWTEDTYYITGGTISGFFAADGGTFYISGGHFTEIVMFNNGNDEADLEVNLSGNAEFDRLEHMIYTGEESSRIHMTISDDVRVGAMMFEIMGNGTLTYPVLTVNGGYFTVDPRTWLDEVNGDTNVVQILAEPEQYSGQTDWAADSETYTRRVKQPFISHSLSLNGDIGVNFYIGITAEQAENASVTFTWTAGNKNNTETVSLKDAVLKEYGYKATCHIAPAEMTCPVTATLTVNGEVKAINTYSAKQYADVILTDEGFARKYTQAENENGNDGEQRLAQLRALVTNMLHYGAAAQAQFDINAETPANNGLEPLSAVSTDDIAANGSDMTENLAACGLEYTGSTLVCRTETVIRHYYRVTDQNAFNSVKDSITIDGEPARYKERNGEICFEITDIAAADLDTEAVLKIGANSYRYSAMDYAKRALRNVEEGSLLCNLVTALYWYNHAANAYFGA